MIPFILITSDEFYKVFSFKLKWNRYLFTLIWYLIIGYFIYYLIIVSEILAKNVERSCSAEKYVLCSGYAMFAIVVYFGLYLIKSLYPIKRQLTEKDSNKMDKDFKNRTGIVIACHNSHDVIESTIERIILHYPANNIHIADNNRHPEPINKGTEEICDKYNVNYNYIPMPGKTNALYKVVSQIHNNYDYLIALDDDTLMPVNYYLSEDDFKEDEQLGGIGFGITIKNKCNIVTELVDYEYKIWCYNSYIRNLSSSKMIIGIAGIWRASLFKRILEVNPAGKTLPFGEDGWNGVIARLNSYKLKQDFQNMVETFSPESLFYDIKDLSCRGEQMCGYGASNIWKQRALRWYRSGNLRIIPEIYTILFFDASNSKNNLFIRLLQNIHYRVFQIWSLLLMYWALMIPFTGYIYRNNYGCWVIIYIKITTYISSVLAHLYLNYFVFRNRSDIKVPLKVIMIYPLFTYYIAIMRCIGFFGTIFYYFPFKATLSLLSCFKLPDLPENDIEMQI